jgi:hypothetical protein
VMRFWLRDGENRASLDFDHRAFGMLRRVVVHEIGHAEVGHHFGVAVLGVALYVTPPAFGFTAAALYEPREQLPIEDICTICAGGSAGEILAYGEYSEVGARNDRSDVMRYDGTANYDELVERAKGILSNRKNRFDRLSSLFEARLLSNTESDLERLPSIGQVGALVLNQDDFMLEE